MTSKTLTKEVVKPVQASVNIGMIGHVDHGKTSLTKALSGKWTDTHSEELKKGISIRLGYADSRFYQCKNVKGAESFTVDQKKCEAGAQFLRKVSFVDAPGHETLMNTMLSGASLMNGAILVIAANEKCPQPRTEEHLMALAASGVKQIIVAQNKIDLVTREQALENHKQIIQFLKKYGYEKVPIIPTAANFGTNIDLLIESVQTHIQDAKTGSSKTLKMYVVRSFDVNKPGTKSKELIGGVIGGTIIEGTIKTGQDIEISPGFNGKKLKTKVVGLSVDEGKIEEAGPGGLIAIGTQLDPNYTRNDQMRGQMVSIEKGLPEPIQNMELDVTMLDRLVGKQQEELKINDVLVLTIGTMTAVGTIVKVKGKMMSIALKMPVVAEKGIKVAISKKDGTRWRLVAYGVSK